MSWLKAGAATSATTLSRTVLAVRPFLSDPTRLVRLPTRIKVFVLLLAVSVFSLIQVLTGVMTIIMSPARAVARLCVGTFCFHLAFLVLRREEQLRRLTSVERMPYTMTTGVTMLAAAWAAAENKRLGSYLFGALHLFAFSLDAFSHIPGGKRVATWLIKAYLSFFRWLLALVGIKIEPPAWMRHAVAGKEPSEMAAAEAAAASQSPTSTWLRSLLPSFATRTSKPADDQAAAAKAAAAGASKGATELASRAVATQAIFVPLGRRAQDGAPRTTQPLEAITEETRGPKAAQYSAPKVAGAPDTTPSAAPARYDASFAAGPPDTTRAWQAALDTAAALAAALATDTMRSHRAEASKAVHAREGVVPSERPKLIEAEILARRAASATRVSATELITELMTASRATARPDAPSTARP
ncbi:hypothetical protein Ctob_006061, partial [Chrysochromulina tobinii]